MWWKTDEKCFESISEKIIDSVGVLKTPPNYDSFSAGLVPHKRTKTVVV